MARLSATLALLLLGAFSLAGCSGGGDEDDGPTSSSAPTTQPPATGQATAVEITSAPASGPAGGKATVCFTVSGTGRVNHVAIHWDNVTHATEPSRSFQSYNDGVSYPNNRTTADPNGYLLQPTGTRFCTAAALPDTGAIFVVAHAMDSDGAPGDLTTERKIDVMPADADITIQNSAYTPATVAVRAGETVMVENLDAFTHTVTSDTANEFDTGDIAGGGSATFTAPNLPGSYPYHCAKHASMHGTLTVTAG